MTRRQSNRRGYALMLVMIFVVLFGAMLGVAWRRVASALRIENASEVRRRCDEGGIQVLAQAMTVLETCARWSSASGVTLNGSTEASFKKQAVGGQWYKITFSRTTSDSSNPADWSVSVVAITDEESLSVNDSLPSNPP